ncbi:MAG: hypothetical protein PHQ75_07770 [Thermoguttaceae bacterium]|nr:hypothetical protein [Thermoguttaceae bacterium]
MSKYAKPIGLAAFLVVLSWAFSSNASQPAYSHAPSQPKWQQVFVPPVTWAPPLGPIVVPEAAPTVTYYGPPVYVNNYPPVLVQGPVIVRSPWRPFLRTFIP